MHAFVLQYFLSDHFPTLINSTNRNHCLLFTVNKLLESPDTTPPSSFSDLCYAFLCAFNNKIAQINSSLTVSSSAPPLPDHLPYEPLRWTKSALVNINDLLTSADSGALSILLPLDPSAAFWHGTTPSSRGCAPGCWGHCTCLALLICYHLITMHFPLWPHIHTLPSLPGPMGSPRAQSLDLFICFLSSGTFLPSVLVKWNLYKNIQKIYMQSEPLTWKYLQIHTKTLVVTSFWVLSTFSVSVAAVVCHSVTLDKRELRGLSVCPL